jgi:hypothetical protein
VRSRLTAPKHPVTADPQACALLQRHPKVEVLDLTGLNQGLTLEFLRSVAPNLK